ncbi:hypothetical protein [Nocardia iowensis]|uniref:Ornithine cyclodeaminase n=1 Tax=Nocardia iowensis TaxID=204891 RepID=A0ABX8RXM5_NOCIO|nr:hypothetical protein [Nocardia iowensis]QXN93125.1 hypothetical protein KV110_08480 [Nocardia iowensis]
MTESMLFLDRSAVMDCVAGIDVVAEVGQVLRDHSAQRTSMPEEGYLSWTNSTEAQCRSLAMLGGVLRDSGDLYGLKVINAAVDNPRRGLERAGGVAFLFDPETARPRCMVEASYLSAARTAGYSVLSIELLGPPAWNSAAFIGCGTQAAMHIELMVGRFPTFGAVHLYDVDRSRAAAFAAATAQKFPQLRIIVAPTVEQAVRSAPVIITVTTSTTPYIPGGWIADGSFVAHVSLDDLTEDALVGARALYVDDIDLVRDNPRRILGRMLSQEPTIGVTGTLGEVLAGSCPVVRPSTSGYVVSNPFGMSILDVGLIAAVECRARQLGLGQLLELR